MVQKVQQVDKNVVPKTILTNLFPFQMLFSDPLCSSSIGGCFCGFRSCHGPLHPLEARSSATSLRCTTLLPTSKKLFFAHSVSKNLGFNTDKNQRIFAFSIQHYRLLLITSNIIFRRDVSSIDY